MNKMNVDELKQVAGGAGGSADQRTQINGNVIERLPNGMFKVQLDNGNIVDAHLSGWLRTKFVKVDIGDQVTVELGPDSSRGKITWRARH